MDLQLQNKIIIVSGGAKGIGEGIVKLLAAEGAMPIIIGKNEDDNLKTVEAIKSTGGKCYQVAAELTKPEECKKAIEQIMNEFGTIDGLVNNAGVNDGVGLEHSDYESFMASLHRSLIHYYLLAHYALPALKISKGSIVNISSKTSETNQGSTSAYAASNGGKNALTREWAVELLKYGIRVNAIVVAEIRARLYEQQTNIDPEKKLKEITSKPLLKNKMTTIEEMANVVAFLLSEKSSHTTGQLIHVDGSYVHLDRAMANAEVISV
ncbi:MAG: SDR family oxidoreductase [Parafilimonas sp.]